MAKRASGVLLHPTCLPGPFGIGDLGESALGFLGWLEQARQSIWQVLPVGPVGDGNSPYTALSSQAGNPLLIDPAELQPQDLISAGDLEAARIRTRDRVPFGRVHDAKSRLFRQAFESLSQRGNRDPLVEEIRAWAASQSQWLEGWSLYAALKGFFAGESWLEWPAELRWREPSALDRARGELAPEIDYQKFLQFLFFRQWNRLRAEAHRRGIQLFGDLPFYVALDSCEVWLDPYLFDLDETGRPRHVAGVPPDYFSATGQRWGNPIYRWERHAEEGYRWWTLRLQHQLDLVDCLRLDHFRGFAGYWEIPAEHDTAAQGRWRPGPGKAVFEPIGASVGSLPFVAEDLGVITPDVEQLRDDLGLPGMKVLQFAFDGQHSPHMPHNLARRTVFYTGTHDNDTAEGWLHSLDGDKLGRVLDYLGGTREEACWSLVRAAETSIADWVIVPFQDLAGLDSRHRMNTPGTAQGNWGWRLPKRALTSDLAARLGRLTEVTDRQPSRDD